MPNMNITELDFFAVKEQLKTFLKNQDKFKDYDFDGSNMAVLLDVLSYNTYQSNFYTNMALNEAFLDSAILRQSVMSHAKSLNYLPRSAKSAQSIVKVVIVSTNNESSFVIPAGSKFTAKTTAGDSYTFYTDTGHIALREANSNRYIADCVPIFEGTVVTERFTITEGFEGFYIQNENIDTSSVRLVNTTTGEEYFYRADIFGTTQDDTVFYLEADKNSYRVVFGADNYGKMPLQSDVMTLTYRTSNGSEPNGINQFTLTQYSNATVTVRTPAYGGAEKESLDSIRFYAPRSIQVQERAVTRRDYEILLKQRFPQILDVSAYDGADLNPPQHGKVAISVNVDGGLSTADKNAFLTYLEDKSPIAIRPVFIDADFMYISLVINVRVNNAIRTKSDGEIKQLVKDTVKAYDLANLEKFASVYQDSRLTASIDDADRSIRSTAIATSPYIEYSPDVRIRYSPTFKFGSELIRPYPFNATNGFANYKPAVKGQTFVYNGTRAFFQDDGNGNIQIISADASNVQVIDPNIGTVNYLTGEVNLSDFIVESYDGNAIKVYANVVNEDITSPKNLVLSIKDEDITVTIIGS
jgi:hypothetical protein